MSKTELITVVIPVYNRAHFIVKTLESVLQQSYRPLEVVVVDDGSSDELLPKIEEWRGVIEGEDGFEVRVVSQENSGANAARNRGIDEARGEYIAFLDSDDNWLPEKLVKQVRLLLDNTDYGGVYCDLVEVDLATGNREETVPRIYSEGNILKEMLVSDVTAPTSCWMVKKRCFSNIGKFDVNLPARQDWDMWIRLSSKYKIGCIGEVLVEMGNHSGERVRSDGSREIRAHKIIFNKYKALRDRYPFWISLASRSAMYRRRGRVYYHRNVSWPRALGMQLSAILVWPFAFDSYAALLGMLLPAKVRQSLHIIWNKLFGKTALAIKVH